MERSDSRNKQPSNNEMNEVNHLYYTKNNLNPMSGGMNSLCLLIAFYRYFLNDNLLITLFFILFDETMSLITT